MSIIQIVIVLAIIGVILWLITTYIPMPPPFKTVIIVVAVLCLCLWLLNIFGMGTILTAPVGHR